MTEDININFPAVVDGRIGGDLIQTVNARDLHEALKAGKDFSNWIKDRIEKYGFVENQDFVCSPVLASNGRGGHNRLEYHLTLDTAKEIAMVDGSDVGRTIRRYFIRMERVARSAIASPDIARLADHLTVLTSRLAQFEEGLPAVVARQVEHQLSTDTRRAVLEYISVRQLLDDAKARPKGRRGLNAKVGNELRSRAALAGGMVARRCAHSNTWLFQRDFASGYMKERGYMLVHLHNRDPDRPVLSLFDTDANGRPLQ